MTALNLSAEGGKWEAEPEGQREGEHCRALLTDIQWHTFTTFVTNGQELEQTDSTPLTEAQFTAL